MKFTPKTKDEIEEEKREFAESGLLPAGWYDFEVMLAEDAVSKKSGRDMLKIKLRVFAPDGREKHVYDYLIETSPVHFFDFCESVGLSAQYAAGTIDADELIGRAARVQIAIDNKDPNFAPKNVAKNYGAPKEPSSGTISKLPKAPDEDGDEIPW